MVRGEFIVRVVGVMLRAKENTVDSKKGKWGKHESNCC